MKTFDTLVKRVDAFASLPHYEAHIKPIYDKLPEEIKGKFCRTPQEMYLSDSQHVLVCSFADLRYINPTKKTAILSEHGLGFFYNEEHESYAGSRAGRHSVILKLSPNELNAAKERETIKKTPVVVVGVPKMDEWYKERNTFMDTFRDVVRTKKRVVCISFHWDCKVSPESRSAYLSYVEFLERFKGMCDFKGVELIGHAHPKIMETMVPYYEKAGIPVEKDWNDVMRKADVYMCDNSSTIFEFAYLRKPVVLINAPTYRRKVEHLGNPRFWRNSNIGPVVNDPDDLYVALELAWYGHLGYLEAIDRAVETVFTFTDGKCTERAVQAIKDVIQ